MRRDEITVAEVARFRAELVGNNLGEKRRARSSSRHEPVYRAFVRGELAQATK
jgi:hypothetical protein